jgi:DNA invertase Pin-like site-specific DNA recombinase
METLPSHPDAILTPAVLYGAKSTEDRNDSISTQLAEAREMAAQEGRVVVAEFSDEGFSAYTGNRGPGLARAKRAAVDAARQHGTTAMLIAQASDRYARGAGDSPQAAVALTEIWHELRRLDVHLRSVEDDQELRDAQSVAAIGQRAMMDSRRKSKAVKKGMKRRAAKGLHNGRPPLGYDNDGGYLVLNATEASLVRRIFADYASGLSQQAITRRLCREGVKTKLGGQWHQGTAAKVLRNRVYLGELQHGGQWRAGTHDAIVDLPTWEAVEALLSAGQRTEGRRGRPSAGSHIFRKGMLRCGICGDSMVPRSAPYEVYNCMRKKREGANACAMPAIPRALVDDSLRRYFEKVALDIDATRRNLAAGISRRSEETRAAREQAEREESRAGERLARVRRAFQDGKITADDWAEQRPDLTYERKAAASEAHRLRARERQVAATAEVHDDEAETLRALAQLRRVVAGDVRGAETLDGVRSCLLRLFSSFTLHYYDEAVCNHVAPEPRWTDPDLEGPGYYLEPHVRPEMVESAAPAGYEEQGLIFPTLHRVPLPDAATNEYEGFGR